MGWLDKLFGKAEGEKKREDIHVAQPAQKEDSPKSKALPEEDYASSITLISAVEEILANFLKTPGAEDNFVFFDPEENECFVYMIASDKVTLLTKMPVHNWDGLLMNLKACNGRKVSISGKFFLIFVGVYLSNLGERASAFLFENLSVKDEEITERKRRVIRQINRLKPATALTWKNKEHLARIIESRTGKTTGDLYQILLEDQVFSQEQIDALKAENDVMNVLDSPVSRKMIVKSLAKWLGVEYFDPELSEIDEKLARTLPRQAAFQNLIIPVEADGENIRVACWNPFDEKSIIKIKEHMGDKVTLLMSSEEDIRYMLEKIYEE